MRAWADRFGTAVGWPVVPLWSAFLLFIYYLYFARRFLAADIVMGGDTQLLWSLNYLAFYSIAHLGEFLWWDPTTVNGWPAYVNLTSGWFNYLSPYALPSIALFLLADTVGKADINAFLVFQKTLYYFTLNLLALSLITRELVKSTIARLLPPLIFTLSAIQFHGFRDSVLYEVLPGALFYVFALIYYNNRRTPQAVAVLLLFSGLFLASLNYGALQTSLWWAGTFTVLLAVFQTDVVTSACKDLRFLAARHGNRTMFWLLALLAITALLVFYVPVHFNLGEVIRVPGDGRPPQDDGLHGGFRAGDSRLTIAALSHPIWTNLLYWAPFDAIHNQLLTFDVKTEGEKAGVDHRYIGLATLPLIFTAIVLGYRNRYVLVLLLTAFTCTAFITYTSRNLLVSSLAEILPVLKNIRTVADTLPRDGPIILLAIAAGMGLDSLLIRPERKSSCESSRANVMLLRWLLAALAVLATGCLLFSIQMPSPYAFTEANQRLVGVPRPPDLKEAGAHIGIYLSLFALLCLLLLCARSRNQKTAIAMVILFLTFFDLTISSTAYWQRGKVWFDNEGPHALPHIEKFGPVDSPLHNWPGSHTGFIHNPFGGPYMGLRSWLTLAANPEWLPVLENWDGALRVMKKYPDFRFFAGGRYIPFDASMAAVSQVAPPTQGLVYVHSEALAVGVSEEIPAAWKVTRYTPNRVEMLVSMPRDGIMVFLDNYERFWSAEIDGAATPVHRANFTFKAIAVPAGEHRVKWQYNPYPVKLAWAAFYGVLVMTLAIMAGQRFRYALVLVCGLGVAGVGGYYAMQWRLSTQSIARTARPELVAHSGQLTLVLDKERAYPVVEGNAGYVEGVFYDSTGITKIIGWAIDDTAVRAPTALVVALGDEVWFSGHVTRERGDIAALNPGYRRSGFHLYGRGAPSEALARLRVFALRANGTAVELQYAKGVRNHGAAYR